MDLVMLLVSAAILLLAIVAVIIARVRSRDEIYSGVTPGQVPASGDEAHVERVPTGEYRGTIPVQFAPPKDVAPAHAGGVIDGQIRMKEVTATIVDLAVRGYLTITPIDAEHGARSKKDWMLTVNPEPPGEPRDFELRLLQELFGPGPKVRFSDLQSGFGMAMREAQVSLYEQLVSKGWYDKHPRGSGGPSKGWGIGLIVAGVVVVLALSNMLDSAMRVLPGLAMIVAGIVVLVGGRGIRVPRTAKGTAMRIQSLGFKQYLVTAEADQIKFEEAADIFSKYLPYAIVFGVAERWSKLFGEVAKKHQLDNNLSDVAMLDLMTDLMWIDLLSGGGITDGLVGGLGDFDFGDLGGMFEGVGDGFGDLGDALGEGVGGIDLGGCDLGDLDFDGCGD